MQFCSSIAGFVLDLCLSELFSALPHSFPCWVLTPEVIFLFRKKKSFVLDFLPSPVGFILLFSLSHLAVYDTPKPQR